MSDKENIIKLFNLLNEKELNVKLSKPSLDGRVNSIINEDIAKNFLKAFCDKNSLKYESGKERAWYDCKIDETPYNIKITAGHTADNLSSKKGLVYCLTGNENIGISHQEAINTISKCYNMEDHDYGLIVLNK